MAADLLNAAIKEHQIPRWPYEASFDRIVVFSVPEDKASRDTYVPDGVIVKPETVKDREENETPRGIIVSAGLGARDVLLSHGMGLGHMVWVARLSPWRHVVERRADGSEVTFLFLRAGDIVGSETLQDFIKRGLVKVTTAADGRHVFEYEDGAAPRFDPPDFVA